MKTEQKYQQIRGKDIVIMGLQSWDDDRLGSNCKDLAVEFARHNRVLYVNSSLTRFDLFKKKPDPLLTRRLQILKGNIPALQQVSDNLWSFNPQTVLEPVNKLRPAFLFDFVNRINNRRIAAEIKKTTQKIGFKDFILFNDQEMYRGFYLKELLKPASYFYYIRDNLILTDFFRRNGGRLEPKLIEKADLVITNSTYLSRYAEKYNSETYYIGQGCDFSLFNPAHHYPKPADLRNIPYPRIGYVGALVSMRLDIELLSSLARLKPDWKIVLVGPEDADFKSSLLHAFPNVFFLGSKPMQDLPSYIQHFDVCINPQLLNDMTVGNYPRKADEYLAMGKPLVARLTDGMEIFSAFSYLAKNQQEFLSHIETALAQDSEELHKERRAFALQHTWEQSFADLSAAYFSMLDQRHKKIAAGKSYVAES